MWFNIEHSPVDCPVLNLKDFHEGGLNSLKFFSPSLVSENLTSVLVDSSLKEIRTICSDVDLLIRMQEGQKLDPALSEELLSRMSDRLNPEEKAIFDSASDEEILDSVRSKYIQTPAQLEAYLRSLDSRFENMSSQEISEVIDNSEDTPASDNSSSVSSDGRQG